MQLLGAPMSCFTQTGTTQICHCRSSQEGSLLCPLSLRLSAQSLNVGSTAARWFERFHGSFCLPKHGQTSKRHRDTCCHCSLACTADGWRWRWHWQGVCLRCHCEDGGLHFSNCPRRLCLLSHRYSMRLHH